MLIHSQGPSGRLKTSGFSLSFQHFPRDLEGVFKSSLRILVWFEVGLVWGLVSGRMKTSGFALGFQNFPRDHANVNEWKIMFDPPSICIENLGYHPRFSNGG